MYSVCVYSVFIIHVGTVPLDFIHHICLYYSYLFRATVCVYMELYFAYSGINAAFAEFICV